MNEIKWNTEAFYYFVGYWNVLLTKWARQKIEYDDMAQCCTPERYLSSSEHLDQRNQ